jgi:prolyl 4-hydroxylase
MDILSLLLLIRFWSKKREKRTIFFRDFKRPNLRKLFALKSKGKRAIYARYAIRTEERESGLARTEASFWMGQKCSTLVIDSDAADDGSKTNKKNEMNERDLEDERVTEITREFVEFGRCCSLQSGGDDSDDEELEGLGRDNQAPFCYKREERVKVVGEVDISEGTYSSRKGVCAKWVVGERDVREAMANLSSDGKCYSKVFELRDTAFQYVLKAEREGTEEEEEEIKTATALVSVYLKSTKPGNLIDIALTMRVILICANKGERILLQEAYSRQTMDSDCEYFGLRNFFKSRVGVDSKIKNDIDDGTLGDRFQLVCETEFESILSFGEINKIGTSTTIIDEKRHKTPIVAYCVSENPLLFVFENFLQDSETDALLDLASQDLKRSRVTDGKLSNGRTSSSAFLIGAKGKEEVVLTIEKRMLDSLRTVPIINSRRNDTRNLQGSEPMQIVRYTRSEKYTSHFDNKAGSFRRIATFMVYLSDQCKGGCTFFPKGVPSFQSLNEYDDEARGEEIGIKIHPKKGRAILFFSISEGPPFRENPSSLHEGMTVQKGEKYIATKWLTREPVDKDDDEAEFFSSDAEID